MAQGTRVGLGDACPHLAGSPVGPGELYVGGPSPRAAAAAPGAPTLQLGEKGGPPHHNRGPFAPTGAELAEIKRATSAAKGCLFLDRARMPKERSGRVFQKTRHTKAPGRSDEPRGGLHGVVSYINFMLVDGTEVRQPVQVRRTTDRAPGGAGRAAARPAPRGTRSAEPKSGNTIAGHPAYKKALNVGFGDVHFMA